jgi:hypothetical protein
MSAVAITRTYAVPRGASAHEAMLAAIQAGQTAKADPRAADHMLSQMGLTGR